MILVSALLHQELKLAQLLVIVGMHCVVTNSLRSQHDFGVMFDGAFSVIGEGE